MNIFNDKQSVHEKELAEIRECLQVILSIDKVGNNLCKLEAKRQDNIVHTVVYSPWLFPTRALYKAKKQLIDEIELVSGKSVYVVTEFLPD